MNKTNFCRKGHDKNLVGRRKGNRCAECNRIYHREWAKKNKSIVVSNALKWQKNHMSQVKEIRWKEYGIKNQDGTSFKSIDFDRLYQTQQGKCAICKIHQSELKRVLSVDHNHKTGIVRGLLCVNCNRDLHVIESENFMKLANQYLNPNVIISNNYIRHAGEETE